MVHVPAPVVPLAQQVVHAIQHLPFTSDGKASRHVPSSVKLITADVITLIVICVLLAPVDAKNRFVTPGHFPSDITELAGRKKTDAGGPDKFSSPHG